MLNEKDRWLEDEDQNYVEKGIYNNVTGLWIN